MGDYARPKNPQSIPSTKIRVFDGIGGPRTQILKRFDKFRGWDISNTVANNVSDLHLGEKGSLFLRPGMRRLGSEDYTIGWIGQMTIGGLLRYGVIYGGGLTMIDLPMRKGYDPIPWPPDDPPADPPDDWPDDWPWRDDPVDDVIPEDPSLPIEKQVCEIAWEWDSSPVGLSFTFPYADSPTPATDNWYWKGEGYRPEFLTGVYSSNAAWYNAALLVGGSWDIGPCHGLQWGGLLVTPTGKDAAGDWLVPGTYNHTKTLRISDGTDLEMLVTLVVVGPAITLDPTFWDQPVTESAAGNLTKTINISNTGDTGSTLNWEYSVSGDSEITDILTSDVSSGALAKSANKDIVFTLTDPGSVAVGDYEATITFVDSLLGTVTETLTINMEVISGSTGYYSDLTWTYGAAYTYTGLMSLYSTLTWRINRDPPYASSYMELTWRTTKPTGNFTYYNADTGQSANGSYDDILAGYTAPFWMYEAKNNNNGAKIVSIGVKTTGASLVGTYTQIWQNSTLGSSTALIVSLTP